MAPPLLPESTVQWLSMPEADQHAEEELRLAVVLNGGVSLAVWMGGVVLELQRLTNRHGIYGRLLDALNARARADIIAGTSAGGINGGALAVGQVYPHADIPRMRDVWAEQGALYDLLQDPWTSNPASLLKGDAAFLPALRSAFADLLSPSRRPGASAYSPEIRPIHLTLTTTLLTADARSITDALGATVAAPSHTGRFRFLRIPAALGVVDHFGPPVGNLADKLALAARCTASFPVAFEPVLVKVTPPDGQPGGPSPAPTQTAPLGDPSPDMSAHANFTTSRWVVDGGVLMNTPLRPVLEAIQAAPAGIQVRRALLLVVPDPYVASTEEMSPVTADRPPITRTLARIVQSVESQTVAEELRLIEEHNMRAQARRDSRTDMLRTVTSGHGSVADDLTQLASTLFRNYRDIRISRAANSIAAQTAPILGVLPATLAHQIRGALQDQGDQQRHLPWVPDTFAQGLIAGVVAATGPFRAPGATGPADWEWGLATLERMAVAVQDLLKRAVWVMGPGQQRNELMRLRERHSQALAHLLTLRRADSAYWRTRAERARAAQPAGSLSRETLAQELDRGLDEWRNELQDHVTGPIGGPMGRRQVSGAPPLSDLARELIDIGHQAAERLPAAIDDPDGLLQADRLEVLRRVFEPDDPDQLMRSVLGLEVCYLCLVESDDPTASEQVIELVRISAGVDQPFAPGLAAADRVAGLRLGHFGAFLKQAWRVNDWTWGRMDAANRLVWLLLDPARLRRQVLLSGTSDAAGRGAPGTAADTGSPTARRVLGLILGADPGPEWSEVLALLDGRIPLTRGRAVLAPLADQLIRALAEQIVAEEEPALYAAVRADEDAGENERSAGSRWLNKRFPADAQGGPVR